MWKLEVPAIKSNNAEAEKALAELFQRTDLGFFDFELLEKGLQASLELAGKCSSQYEQIAILGIGGSCLGVQTLVECLAPQILDQHKILFFDNVDAKSFYRKLELCGPKTLWVLISKSGTTIETLSQAEFIEEYLQSQGRTNLAQNAVVITENKSSPLFDWGKTHGVPFLEIPLSIGGRFSVLSPVGLFPAAFLGLDVKGVVAGAKAVMSDLNNVKELTAQFLASFERGEHLTYFFSYSDDLKFWNQWIQQLWAESLGKKQTTDGKPAPITSVPYACRGSTDQHSVLQQLAEDPQRKFVCFLRVAAGENSGPALGRSLFAKTSLLQGKSLGRLLAAEAQATREALEEAQIKSVELSCSDLGPGSVGELLFTFEVVVAVLGIAKKINPFDQPGVERGKVIARSILSR